MIYGIIPINIRRSQTIPDKAKLLYCEITATMNEQMECLLTNEEFAEILNVTPTTARRHIYDLRELGLINVTSGENRVITLPDGIIRVDDESRKKKTVKNTEKAKELATEIVTTWNEMLGTRIRVTPQLIGVISSRLKGFSEADVKEAVGNRISTVISSKWHNEDENRHHRNDIYLVIRDDKVMQKNLNSKIGKQFREDDSGNQIKMMKFR